MDIHPPHAIRSWKDFFVQLVTITAGILIALSLEGVRESMHNRSIASEARENIRRELADNKREVDNELAHASDRNPQFDTALKFANDLLATKKTNVKQFGLNLGFASLSDASWQTAERTGALAHMDYAEVQNYAEAYRIQTLLQQQHGRALDGMAAALALLGSGDGDPTKAPPADLERFRQQVMTLRSVLYIEEQISKQAVEKYQAVLDHR